MHYLEDFLELIEHLPQEMRDHLTEMRETDLSVQNATDTLDKKMDSYFARAPNMTEAERKVEFGSIKEGFQKALEERDENVALATQMQETVQKYSRILQAEIEKFRAELEADNPGITEILEKRSLELDRPPQNSSQKENRYSFPSSRSRDNHSHSRSERRRDSRRESSSAMDKAMDKAVDDIAHALPEPKPASANSGQIIASPSLPQTSTSMTNSANAVNYSIGHMGVGGPAIAAAVSQAIAATQQMQQGRRTASLKASYEAINTGSMHVGEFGREITGAAQTAIAAVQETTKKHKKRVTTTAPSTSVMPAVIQQSIMVPTGAAATATIGESENPDWLADPNEPRYCICNQVSFGDMVACDNVECPCEWFHYPCVGITAPPKGKWYCPQCISSMKRRGNRKN